MAALHRISKEKEHDYLFLSEMVGIEQIIDGYKLKIRNADGDIEHVTTAWVVNTGGLYSDIIAQKNGVPDNYIIDQKELSALEPQIRGIAALFVGCTNI